MEGRGGRDSHDAKKYDENQQHALPNRQLQLPKQSYRHKADGDVEHHVGYREAVVHSLQVNTMARDAAIPDIRDWLAL